MPWSALPPHINEPNEWKNTDWWENPIQRWMLKFKGYFAYGPRAIERYARWRELPITVFAAFGKGHSRWENTDGSVVTGLLRPKHYVWYKPWNLYLSAIQYWTKWHFQLQWPFFVAFHYYLDHTPRYPMRPWKQRMFYFRFGARRDADKVYWFPSLYIGCTWN